jgi:hypothetical protein
MHLKKHTPNSLQISSGLHWWEEDPESERIPEPQREEEFINCFNPRILHCEVLSRLWPAHSSFLVESDLG